MRILWFTNTPSNAYEDYNYKNYGGGWISSLETLIAEVNHYNLGICFYYSGEKFKKIKRGSVVYYGMPIKIGNPLSRIITRQLANLDDEDATFINDVIEDFKPDLIHVFGTERGYGKVLRNRPEKIVFNLQGLLSPITAVYFPLEFSKWKALWGSGFNSIIRGTTMFHDFQMLRKKATREKIIIEKWHYFIGRTDWDRNYISLINPAARYFHCEEMLRKEFFSAAWVQPSEVNPDNEIVIGTTINTNLFKGIDLIYRVLALLPDYKIKWKVFGIKREDRINRMVCKVLKINPGSINIDFHDQVDVDDLISQLKTCHFFVHPSYIDNSSNSVCEAMLLGMPVLTSSVGGLKSLVKDGETGFFFNPYDKYDLAGLLINLINNYEKAMIAGTAARKVAASRHSSESIMSRMDQIYNFILDDPA